MAAARALETAPSTAPVPYVDFGTPDQPMRSGRAMPMHRMPMHRKPMHRAAAAKKATPAAAAMPAGTPAPAASTQPPAATPSPASKPAMPTTK